MNIYLFVINHSGQSLTKIGKHNVNSKWPQPPIISHFGVSEKTLLENGEKLESSDALEIPVNTGVSAFSTECLILQAFQRFATNIPSKFLSRPGTGSLQGILSFIQEPVSETLPAFALIKPYVKPLIHLTTNQENLTT